MIIKMLRLSLNELRLIVKYRGIKGYKNVSEDRLLSALNASELVKESEKNFADIEFKRMKIMMLMKYLEKK